MTNPTSAWRVLILVAALASGCDQSTGDEDARDAARPLRDGGATLPDVDGGVGPRVDAGPHVGPTECNDGIDNDGDGYVDWQLDVGCYGPNDRTEVARPREEEDGFTTFDVASDSVVIFVSNEGDDANDGRSPENAVRTISHGASLLRDGQHDFLLLRRGDRWRDEQLGRFISGRSASEPLVIASYGEETARPRIEVGGWFINHDGHERSNFALVGLEIVPYRNIPGDPQFTGDDASALRLVGGGTGILIEDCHFLYGEIVLTSYADLVYDGLEIRRNVIERVYHRDTCLPGNLNGNVAFRPSGIFASGIHHLRIEENLFDHNGWNAEEVPSACATIYNHNVYMPSLVDAVVVGNVFSRPSSIHIKATSSSDGGYDRFLVENNFFVGGEIGMSIGGNSDGPSRFRNVTIRDNVLNQVGRGRPTMRGLSWGIDIQDNDVTTIEHNLLLNFDEGNSWGIALGNATNRDVTVRENLLYAVGGAGFRYEQQSGFANISFEDNEVVDPRHGACLVRSTGGFSAITYQGGRYFSSEAADQWFCGPGRMTFDAWRSASDETGAAALDDAPDYPDPMRDIDRYAASIGLDGSLEAYLEAARGQSRMAWRVDLMASAINQYMRAGFDR